jgi:Na+-transporting methylmalonyl-CoA/oxaloacetate decarboxylase gamma subunit
MSGTLAQNLWAASELLVGFVIVMLALTVLWGLTALMSRVVAWMERPTTDAVPAATPEATPAATPADSLDPADDVIAVVGAAVAILLDRPHRIVHVLPLPSAWGRQGRLDSHASNREP